MCVCIVFSERNLNPKAACLKRREEEKADDGTGSKMAAPHLGAPPPMIPFGSMPPSVSVCSRRSDWSNRRHSRVIFSFDSSRWCKVVDCHRRSAVLRSNVLVRPHSMKTEFQWKVNGCLGFRWSAQHFFLFSLPSIFSVLPLISPPPIPSLLEYSLVYLALSVYVWAVWKFHNCPRLLDWI